MPFFRKKPVTIEAAQWTGNLNDLASVQALDAYDFHGAARVYPCPTERGEELHDLGIQTLEGVMRAKPGDWIIKGVKGEVYPCKPDIFAATYESVPPDAPEPKCKTCGDRGFYSVPQMYPCDHGATPECKAPPASE